jgi:hypothetical protein
MKKCMLTFLMLVWPMQVMGQRVVFNEIGWMGTAASATDEWIELCNVQPVPVDVTGWEVRAADGSPRIKLTGVIPGHGLYLLERTDESTISDRTADLLYTGDLKNSGEWLQIYDSDSLLVDQVRCDSLGWFAGSNLPKRSMEKRNPLLPGNDPANWASNDSLHINGRDSRGNPVYGTPGEINSVFDLTSAVRGHKSHQIIPVTFSAMPNPSNRYVHLTWPEMDDDLRVEIFDLLGRKVRVWESQRIGSNGIYWDGCDGQRRPVSAGIYFGRLIQSGIVIGNVRLLRQ